MPGNIPLQSQQKFSSQPSQQIQQSQHHTQVNAFPSQAEFNNNWTNDFYFGVLHPVVRILSRSLEEPSFATIFQGVYFILVKVKLSHNRPWRPIAL
jgi:hypothetical protein